MSDKVDIHVACPWCNKDLTWWYINDNSDGYCESSLPAINEDVGCPSCGGRAIVTGVSTPTISVARGRSKEKVETEIAEKRKASVDQWRDKVALLRKQFPTGNNHKSLVCNIFGCKWTQLACSGRISYPFNPFKTHSFSVCRRCSSVIDRLVDEPEEFNYWCD